MQRSSVQVSHEHMDLCQLYKELESILHPSWPFRMEILAVLGVGRGWWGDASPRSLLDQTRCKMVKWQLFAPRLFVGNLLLLLLTKIFLLREGFKDRTGQPCAIFPVRKYGKQKETTDIKGFCPLENCPQSVFVSRLLSLSLCSNLSLVSSLCLSSFLSVSRLLSLSLVYSFCLSSPLSVSRHSLCLSSPFSVSRIFLSLSFFTYLSALITVSCLLSLAPSLDSYLLSPLSSTVSCLLSFVSSL